MGKHNASIWRWLLVQSYIARLTWMVADLNNGEQVNSRQYNALLRALEDAGREEQAEYFTQVWYDALRNLEVRDE